MMLKNISQKVIQNSQDVNKNTQKINCNSSNFHFEAIIDKTVTNRHILSLFSFIYKLHLTRQSKTFALNSQIDISF